MTIDSSAVVAIAEEEPSATRLRTAIARDAVRLISAVSVLEVTCVLAKRHGFGLLSRLGDVFAGLAIEKRPFDDVQLRAAQDAWFRFGKGLHPAGLNFGDCAAYALFRTTGEPMLYVGNDFGKTDVKAVVY